MDDYFARCRLAAFDSRALAALNRQESEYLALAAKDFSITAAEVATYYVQKELGGWLLPILFGLSLVKFALVVMFYMHLKFDSRTYSRFFVMGLAGAMTLYLIVLLSLRTFLR